MVLNLQRIEPFRAAATGGEVKLSALRGSKVVLYFYPKDNTPGCTTQGGDFRDRSEAFGKAGAVILGVSRDTLRYRLERLGFKAAHGTD